MRRRALPLAGMLLGALVVANCRRAEPLVRRSPGGGAGVSAPQARPAPLPTPLAPGLDAWLGFAARRPGKPTRRDWTPRHPRAAVVIFSDRWRRVRPGTPLVALFPGGRRPVTYLATTRIRYGCDQNTAVVATFAAAGPVPEGPVWLVAPDAARTAAVAHPHPRKVGRGRGWKLGEYDLRLSRTGELTAALTVRRAGKLVFTQRLTKGDMDGAPREPIRLQSDDDVGIAVPQGALRLRPRGPWFVPLLTPRYEGTGFPVLRLGRRGARIAAQPYLYRCAF